MSAADTGMHPTQVSPTVDDLWFAWCPVCDWSGRVRPTWACAVTDRADHAVKRHGLVTR